MPAPRMPSYRVPDSLAGTGLQWVLNWIRDILEYVAGWTDYRKHHYTDLVLTVGRLNLVKHNLGEVPRGWRVTRTNAPALVYEQTASSDSTYLYLICTQDVTIDLEVW